jgi:hypothetical protein
MAVRGDSLYAGTVGQGVFVLPLTSGTTWQPFRTGLPWNLAWNVWSLHNFHGLLLTGAGASAYIYLNSTGSTTWEAVEFAPFDPLGLTMMGITGKGDTLYGGADIGMYISVDSGRTWQEQLSAVGRFAEASLTATPDGVVYAAMAKPYGTHLVRAAGMSWEYIRYDQAMFIYDIVGFDDRLYAACFDGLRYLPLHPTDVGDEEPTLPDGFDLAQNFPNPFNPATTIEFTLPGRSHVRLDILNALGQRVATILDGTLPGGSHSVVWDGRTDVGVAAASGVYFYRLAAGDFTAARSMILLK